MSSKRTLEDDDDDEEEEEEEDTILDDEPVTKKKKGGSKKRGQESASEPPNCRYDSSLGLLTKKFVTLLQEAEEGVLDLNTAAKELSVQKRRIYDITNVLEGIGLIEKKSKNNIQWRGTGSGPVKEIQEEMAQLRAELEDLNREELLIDNYIRHMQDMLKELNENPESVGLSYVTHDDIRQLPNFKGDTLIAIKAPSGTTLEVPDPDEGMDPPHRRYQIFLKTSDGPIDVFLVSDHPDEDHTSSSSSSTSSCSLSSSACGTTCSSPGSLTHSGVPTEAHELPNHLMSNTASSSMTSSSSSNTCTSMSSPSSAYHTSTAQQAAYPYSTIPPSQTMAMFMNQARGQLSSTSLMKLEPPSSLSDPDYFFTLESGEGIADLYTPKSTSAALGGDFGGISSSVKDELES